MQAHLIRGKCAIEDVELLAYGNADRMLEARIACDEDEDGDGALEP
jgi:hypothetical protein